jgi:hypothetical protein
MADLVDALLARTGLYLGTQTDPSGGHGESGVARIVVTALPGGSGASFDYEVIATDGRRAHAEHSLLVRTTPGLVLITAHDHAEVTSVMTEAEPGYFVAPEGDPFPMAVRVEVPEAGHVVYSWSYGWGDRPLQVRDVGDVRAV